MGLGNGVLARQLAPRFRDYTVVEGSATLAKAFAPASGNCRVINALFEDFAPAAPFDPVAPPGSAPGGDGAPVGLPTGYLLEAPPPLGEGRRTSPLTVGIELAALVASTLLELFTRWVGQAQPPSSPWDPGLATLPLLFLGPRVLGWWFRTYTLTDTHLELDDGILRRRHRVVPYSRVQQVDLRQNVLAQVFRLAALRVETAGEGGAGAVDLRLLTLDDAAALRRFVLDRRGVRPGDPTTGPADGSRPAADAAPLAYELARMSVADLLVSAVTQGPGVLFGGLVVLAGPWLVGAAGQDEPTAAVALLVTLAIVVFVATAVRVVVRVIGDWGWTMTSRGDDLQVRAGLLDVREQSVPRRRIQQVTLVDNPLRRVLGLTSVVLHTAVPAEAQHGFSALVHVPLVRQADVPDLLARVVGRDWAIPDLEPRSPAAARRATVRRLLLLLPGSIGPGLVFGGVAWVMVLLAPTAIPWGRAAHRRAGHAVDGQRLVLSSGVLHHRVDLVPVDRIQSTRTRSSPAQRRLGLATFRVDIAGSTWVGPLIRSPGLFDMDAATAARLRDTLPS